MFTLVILYTLYTTGKTSSHVVKNTLSRHYKTLQFAYFDISKFFK